jgi:hypothetical protein
METKPNFWIFSNTAPVTQDGDDWDMKTILDRKQYYLWLKEKNRKYVQPGDIGIIRVYGDGFWGKFTVGGEWKDDPQAHAGYFPMGDVVLWKRALPQSLIWADLSTKAQRSRLVRITAEDVLKIEVAQRVYERLGFGSAEGEIVILEKGLEEAIKPNLDKLGLKLADKEIQQQFFMGPGVGRSDLICLDKDDNLVVVELKRGWSSGQVVGQILTYIGYVRENIAKRDQKVRGMIITGSYDESLRLAASAANIKVLIVRLP